MFILIVLPKIFKRTFPRCYSIQTVIICSKHVSSSIQDFFFLKFYVHIQNLLQKALSTSQYFTCMPEGFMNDIIINTYQLVYSCHSFLSF